MLVLLGAREQGNGTIQAIEERQGKCVALQKKTWDRHCPLTLPPLCSSEDYEDDNKPNKAADDLGGSPRSGNASPLHCEEEADKRTGDE